MIKVLAGNLSENSIPAFLRNKRQSYLRIIQFIVKTELVNGVEAA